MKTIIVLFAFLVCISAEAQTRYPADGSAVKFLVGLMFNKDEIESQVEEGKLAGGFFIGAEAELPMTPRSIGKSFVPYFAPELNYWHVKNTKNISLGMNFRGKFKAGSTRPYLDFGVTVNRVTLANTDYTRGGFNGGAGIDIQLGKTNISFVMDFKVRVILYESGAKTGFSLTPGFRMGF